MTVLSVGEKLGYLSGLLDEICYVEKECLCFPSRDELIIRSLRDCLDVLNIHSYVVDDQYGRPLVKTDSLDSLIKVYSNVPSFKLRDAVANTISECSGDIAMLNVNSVIDTEFMKGWLAALFDIKGKIYNPPKYRILIRSSDDYIVNTLSEYLSFLLVDWRKFNRNGMYTLSIGRKEHIQKFCASVPLNQRMEIETATLIDYLNKSKTKYDYKELGRLHQTGMSISSICSLLGIPSNKVGYIASMVRKAGYKVKRQR